MNITINMRVQKHFVCAIISTYLSVNYFYDKHDKYSMRLLIQSCK